MDIAKVFEEIAWLFEDLAPNDQERAADEFVRLRKWVRSKAADRGLGADQAAEAEGAILEILGPTKTRRSDAEIAVLIEAVIASEALLEAVKVLRRLRADVTRAPRRKLRRAEWPVLVREAFARPAVLAHLGARGTRKLRDELRDAGTTGGKYAAREILAALVDVPPSWLRDLRARATTPTSGGPSNPPTSAGATPSATPPVLDDLDWG
jgi:hypothetical protein